MLLASILLVIAIPTAHLLVLNISIMTEEAQAQMYDDDQYDEDKYYDNNDNDDSYYKDYNNRNVYDDKGYLQQDKKSKIFPANKVSELGDKWSQWVLGIDTSVFNPFTEDFGQESCDFGLQDNGRLLFLVGAPRDTNTGNFPLHECDVKKGTSILVPILNVICNDLVVGTPLFGANEKDQRICANKIITDAILFDALHVKIDGIEIQNLEQYRIDSPAGGFEFISVPNNVFNTPVGDGNGVSDGFWVLLEDLKPGKHTISFSSALDLDEIPPLIDLYEAGATYNLDVKSRYY